MNTRKQYERSHRIAKTIVCAIVIFLLMMARYFDTVIFDGIAVITWFFAVNPIGYLVESVLHYKHKHRKL